MEQVGRTSGILQARARPKENQPFYRPTVLLEGVSQQDHQEQASYLGLNKKKGWVTTLLFFVSWVQN